MGGDILLVLHQLVPHELDQERAPVAQLGQTLDGVDDQIEAVDVVLHPHVEGGGDGPLLLVAPHVQVFIAAAVGQLMDQGGVAVKREDDRLIGGEDGVVILVPQAVGMLVMWV